MKCNLPKPMSRKQQRELETALNNAIDKNPILAVTKVAPSYMNDEQKREKRSK